MCCWIQRHVTHNYIITTGLGLGTFKHYAIMQFMRDLSMQFLCTHRFGMYIMWMLQANKRLHCGLGKEAVRATRLLS